VFHFLINCRFAHNGLSQLKTILEPLATGTSHFSSSTTHSHFSFHSFNPFHSLNPFHSFNPFYSFNPFHSFNPSFLQPISFLPISFLQPLTTICPPLPSACSSSQIPLLPQLALHDKHAHTLHLSASATNSMVIYLLIFTWGDLQPD